MRNRGEEIKEKRIIFQSRKLKIGFRFCMLPSSIWTIKEALIISRGLSIAEVLSIENMLTWSIYETEEYKKGKNAFKEKRSPYFKAK